MRKEISLRYLAFALLLVFLLTLLPVSDLLCIVSADGTNANSSAWHRIASKDDGQLTADPQDPFHATFANYMTGYYDQRIDVVDGTKISFQVQFPVMADATLVQYAFALVNEPKCFYNNNANTSATNIMLEMVGMPAESTMKMGTSKYLGGRTILGHGAPYDDVRSKDTVYTVTFEKINITEENVNYSWVLTVTGGTKDFIFRFASYEVAHDVFSKGAYIAVGSMAGSTVHSLEVSNLTITYPESYVPTEPTEPEPTEPQPTEPKPTEPEPTEPEIPIMDGEGWNVISGSADSLVCDPDIPTNAVFDQYVIAYLNEKIEVEEGTTISFTFEVTNFAADEAFHYGVSIIDSPRSFYKSDNTSNAVSVEFQSNSNTGATWPLRAVTSNKIGGKTKRAWLANFASPLSADRASAGEIEVTITKVNMTLDGEEYSWIFTLNNGTDELQSMIKASDAPHNWFSNGAYLAIGTMRDFSGHSISVSNVSISTDASGGKPDSYYDEDGRLIVGEIVINANSYESPSYGVTHLTKIIGGGDKPWVPYLTIAAGVAGVMSIVMVIVELVRKGKKEKGDKHET